MRVVRWTRAPVGVGKMVEEKMGGKQREMVGFENGTDRERVRRLAERIVKEEMQAAAVSAEAGAEPVVAGKAKTADKRKTKSQ